MENLINFNFALFADMVKAVVKEAVAEELKAQSAMEYEHNDERLTRDELCKRWHISKATLWGYVNKGKIQPIKIGRRVVFSMGDIIRAEKLGIKRYAR